MAKGYDKMTAGELADRDAELTAAMVKAKAGKDSDATRAAKNELREFRQFWRGLNEWVATCQVNGLDPATGTAMPAAIEATAKGN